MKGAPSRGIFAYHRYQEGVEEIAIRAAWSALAQGDQALVTNEGVESAAQRAFERGMGYVPFSAHVFLHFDARHGLAVALYCAQHNPERERQHPATPLLWGSPPGGTPGGTLDQAPRARIYFLTEINLVGRTRSSRKIILSGNARCGEAPLPWREGEALPPGVASATHDGPTGALFIDTILVSQSDCVVDGVDDLL